MSLLEYESIGNAFAEALSVSMQNTWAWELEKVLRGRFYVADDPPAPLKRFEDGKLFLTCYTRYVERSRKDKTPVGIRLLVYGFTDATHSRQVSEEVLPVTAAKADQLRRLEFIYNLIAVQEGCDYRRVRSPQPVAPQKGRTWPSRK